MQAAGSNLTKASEVRLGDAGNELLPTEATRHPWQVRLDSASRAVEGYDRDPLEKMWRITLGLPAAGSHETGNSARHKVAGRLPVRIVARLERERLKANAIFEYVEVFHNRQRRRSSLGMHTPTEYERIHHHEHAVAPLIQAS